MIGPRGAGAVAIQANGLSGGSLALGAPLLPLGVAVRHWSGSGRGVHVCHGAR
jgi:hypothetical protein